MNTPLPGYQVVTSARPFPDAADFTASHVAFVAVGSEMVSLAHT